MDNTKKQLDCKTWKTLGCCYEKTWTAKLDYNSEKHDDKVLCKEIHWETKDSRYIQLGDYGLDTKYSAGKKGAMMIGSNLKCQ